MKRARAYLVAICDETTHQIIDAAIWSSPEWEQSLLLPELTYVALSVEFEVKRDCAAFGEAARHILKGLVGYFSLATNPMQTSRYKRLIPFLRKEFRDFGVEPHPAMVFNGDENIIPSPSVMLHLDGEIHYWSR